MKNICTYFYNQDKVGKIRSFEDFKVVYVDCAVCDITYKKYTADFSKYSARPFVVVSTQRRYKTLEAAAKAVIASRKGA